MGPAQAGGQVHRAHRQQQRDGCCPGVAHAEQKGNRKSEEPSGDQRRNEKLSDSYSLRIVDDGNLDGTNAASSGHLCQHPPICGPNLRFEVGAVENRRRTTLSDNALSLPPELQTALQALYGHYEKTFNLWSEAEIDMPPVFIVVCNNTSTSKLVYDYVSGFYRENVGGSKTLENGRLALFRNYDENGERKGADAKCRPDQKVPPYRQVIELEKANEPESSKNRGG